MDAVGMRLGREPCPAACGARGGEIYVVQVSIRECTSAEVGRSLPTPSS